MTSRRLFAILSVLLIAVVLIGGTVSAEGPILTSPVDFFGFKPGTSSKLCSWPDIKTYLQLLDKESARVVLPGHRPDGARRSPDNGDSKFGGEYSQPRILQDDTKEAGRSPRAVTDRNRGLGISSQGRLLRRRFHTFNRDRWRARNTQCNIHICSHRGQRASKKCLTTS